MCPFPDGRLLGLAGAGAITLVLATGLVPASAQSTTPPPKIIGPDSVQTGTPRVIELTTQTVDLGGIATVDESADRVATTLNANVAFDRDRAELKPEASARLDALVGELRGTRPGPIDIAGYTDNLGTHEHGVDLSERRARAVRNVLEPRLPGFSFTSRGMAEAEPVAPNDTEENRARNRRVEIGYQRPAETAPAAPRGTPTVTPDASSTARTLEGAGPDGDRYTIEVTSPLRLSGLTQLSITLTQVHPPAPGKYPTMPFLVLEGPRWWTDRSEGHPSGIVLIDRAAGLEHRPASGDWQPATSPSRSRENQCFSWPQQVLERTGATKVSFTCWYANPASDQVDIKVGGAGTIAGVPVR